LTTFYDAATKGAAFLTREDRALLRMHGRDPLRILQGIVTNDIAGAAADAATYAALLSPKGRMQADMRVLRVGADYILDVPRSALASLLEIFRRTIPPLFARFEDRSSTHTMVSVCGARAADVVTAVCDVGDHAPQPDRFLSIETDHPCIVIGASPSAPRGFDIIVPVSSAGTLPERLAAGGAIAIDDAAYDVLRIEHGTPAWGAELDENTIPLEAGLLTRAISTSKGCYTGQEVIIRILHRGHVNRHLRGILLGDAAVPAKGTSLVRENDGKVVGTITSAAYSPALKQTIALAYVRREVELNSMLKTVDGAAATVVALPFQEHGEQ
jgi:aminomethyltransferase